MLTEQANLRLPEVDANPFKNLVFLSIFVEKGAAGGSHSRPSPGLRQGPMPFDLPFWNWNPLQCLHTLEHLRTCNFQALPALARFSAPPLGWRHPTTKWKQRLEFSGLERK